MSTVALDVLIGGGASSNDTFRQTLTASSHRHGKCRKSGFTTGGGGGICTIRTPVFVLKTGVMKSPCTLISSAKVTLCRNVASEKISTVGSGGGSSPVPCIARRPEGASAPIMTSARSFVSPRISVSESIDSRSPSVSPICTCPRIVLWPVTASRPRFACCSTTRFPRESSNGPLKKVEPSTVSLLEVMLP